MATGQTLLILTPLSHSPRATNPATLDRRNEHFCLDFDDTTDEAACWDAVMPNHYSAGGITATLFWMATSAVAGTCRWEVTFERHQAETDDLDADSFAATQQAAAVAPATSGAVKVTTLAFLNTQIDGVAAGESFRLKVNRDADGSTGTDDMSGDAELVAVHLAES